MVRVKARWLGLVPAAVRDLREQRAPATAEELDRFETDALAGSVLARASAGLANATIRGGVGHLEQVRAWFGRPLWEMEPKDADGYIGRVLRESPSGTRLARAQSTSSYFTLLGRRHKVEIRQLTGCVVGGPIDEMNQPPGAKDARLRIPRAVPRSPGCSRGGLRIWRRATPDGVRRIARIIRA